MKIAITPAQRYHLINLLHPADGKVPDGQAGRTYRRTLRAFGVQHIGQVAREHNGVRTAYAQDERTQHIVDVTDEAIDYLLKHGWPRSHIQEDVLGELFDTLDNIKAGRPYDEPEGVALDPEKDRAEWLPARDDISERLRNARAG